ncbi:fumarate reductase subunit C [uncultured Rhodoblastus sp.]|uniref:fumarate reductase subunit C n=1 Tax=uncultured Rhodoblastus sp. TaxID=543037 RepID=UPI0025F4A45F|nr:fumarate reductase subunit C [uncultured Rhodoblastus sp.]
MSERRPYTRPIDEDWWKKPPYLSYTARELSGIAVTIYGGVLFTGLFSLWRGPESYNAFLRFLQSPLSLLLNLLLLAVVVYHVVTWFQTLPKTMPKMIVDGKQVPAAKITQIATLAAGGSSLLLILLTMWVAR